MHKIFFLVSEVDPRGPGRLPITPQKKKKLLRLSFIKQKLPPLKKVLHPQSIQLYFPKPISEYFIYFRKLT